MKPLYTIGEVAELLHLSEAKVRSWVRYGQIDTTRIGGKVLIPLSSLQSIPGLWDSVMMADAIGNG